MSCMASIQIESEIILSSVQDFSYTISYNCKASVNNTLWLIILLFTREVNEKQTVKYFQWNNAYFVTSKPTKTRCWLKWNNEFEQQFFDN